MLQNAYFLAKIGVDTAENERNLPKIASCRSCKKSGPATPGLPIPRLGDGTCLVFRLILKRRYEGNVRRSFSSTSSLRIHGEVIMITSLSSRTTWNPAKSCKEPPWNIAKSCKICFLQGMLARLNWIWQMTKSISEMYTKYSLESSRRDLHNAHRCTALQSQIWSNLLWQCKNLPKCC